MSTLTYWDALAQAGVPVEHRSTATLALIAFLNAHTLEMESEVARLLRRAAGTHEAPAADPLDAA